MSIEAITQALSGIAPLGRSEPAVPSESAQQQFSDLMNSEKAANDASALLTAQTTFNALTVGTELTAKVAGSLTQSINKLVNIQ